MQMHAPIWWEERTLKPKVALRAAAEPNTISTAVTMGLRCLALGPRSLSPAAVLLLLLVALPELACSAADWMASRNLHAIKIEPRRLEL